MCAMACYSKCIRQSLALKVRGSLRKRYKCVPSPILEGSRSNHRGSSNYCLCFQSNGNEHRIN